MSYTKDSHTWLMIRVNNTKWFSKSTMRFFGSRIYWQTLTHYKRGFAFISSEGDDYNSLIPRGWTIRFVKEDWTLGEDLSEFREYPDLASAKEALKQLITKEEVNG